jgi:DNA-binding transcriptional MerR regulator
MQIAELARHGGVSTPTLRNYEELGLIAPSGRTEAGYRLYGPEALGRLQFIQRAKALGLSLAEIRRLVREPSGAPSDMARLRHAVAHKRVETERRIAELTSLRADLEEMERRLSDGSIAVCGHIGDCWCWLPNTEEVELMSGNHETSGCSCCGCTCPSQDVCSCCGCPRPA